MSLSSTAEERLRFNDDVRLLPGSGIPTNGTSGTWAGIAGPGSLYFDIVNSVIYLNTGTKASPTWAVFGISNIAAGSIVTAMLADLNVTTGKIANLAITAAKIAVDTITANEIAPNAIGSSELANGAVDTAAIADLQVTTAKIALLAIAAAQLAPNAVTSDKTADGVLRVASGTITSADLTGTGVGQFGHANGYPLVPAPGAANIIELISAIAIYDFSVAAYTAGGNTTINRAAGAGALSGLISAANSFGAAGDRIALFYPLTTAGVNLTLNEGLNLVTSAAFTQPGTAAGVIRYIVNYRIHATGL